MALALMKDDGRFDIPKVSPNATQDQIAAAQASPTKPAFDPRNLPTGEAEGPMDIQDLKTNKGAEGDVIDPRFLKRGLPSFQGDREEPMPKFQGRLRGPLK